jgi:hypothetical protein
MSHTATSGKRKADFLIRGPENLVEVPAFVLRAVGLRPNCADGIHGKNCPHSTCALPWMDHIQLRCNSASRSVWISSLHAWDPPAVPHTHPLPVAHNRAHVRSTCVLRLRGRRLPPIHDLLVLLNHFRHGMRRLQGRDVLVWEVGVLAHRGARLKDAC